MIILSHSLDLIFPKNLEVLHSKMKIKKLRECIFSQNALIWIFFQEEIRLKPREQGVFWQTPNLEPILITKLYVFSVFLLVLWEELI